MITVLWHIVQVVRGELMMIMMGNVKYMTKVWF